MLRRPATETQITHGGRLWLYVLAGLILLFLIAAEPARHPAQLLGLALPRVPAARLVDALVRGLFRRHRVARRDRAMSFAAATLTMIISTALGTLAAYGLHTSRSPLHPARLRDVHAAADHSGHPDRDRHLPLLRPARAQQHADRHRAGAFGDGHPAGRDHWSPRASRATT